MKHSNTRKRPPAEYAHVVSFRLTDEQAVLAEHLRSSFEYGTWAEMGRWIFTDPDVRELIKAKIDEGGVERTTELVIGQ